MFNHKEPNKLSRTTIAAAVLLLTATAVSAQEHHHSEPVNVQGLGAVSFPISCSAEDQRDFNRGMALLHSFSYHAAHQQFSQLTDRDSSCAMGYWGEAMSLYRQLWERPSTEERAQGLWLILRAKADKIPTAREQAYIDAAAALYLDNLTSSYETRRAAYSEAMRKVHEVAPEDDNATLLYALSLLTSPDVNKNDYAIARQAVALIKPVFEREPNHPGAAHYLIHACDNPALAPLALTAAQRYAQIAPDSPHAVHMPSHIFARLGMWDDDLKSNHASVRVAREQKAMSDALHAMNFLEYAYLQLGKFGDAARVNKEALAIPLSDLADDMPGMYMYTQVRFPALYYIETSDWKAAESMPVPDTTPDFQAAAYWAKTIGAAHLKDVAAARADASAYDAKIDELLNGRHAYLAEAMADERDEVHAWLAYAEGDVDAAVKLLGHAAELQQTVGKNEVELSARAMLGDVLLASGKPAEALAQYEESLRTDPNRFNALLGAARAAKASGDRDAAYRHYHDLIASRQGVENPAITEATAYVDQYTAMSTR